MRYRCTHTHPTTGRQCSRAARAEWSTCGHHIDNGHPVVFHTRTAGLRITVGRSRVRNIARKPEMIK